MATFALLLQFCALCLSSNAAHVTNNNRANEDPFENDEFSADLMIGQKDHRTSNLLRHRHLQTSAQHRGRSVLTFLYLTVFGLCFMTPIFYCFRRFLEDRAVRRRLVALELQGLQAALSQSENNLGNAINLEESRASKRKYIEERRARILQLFAPVRRVSTDRPAFALTAIVHSTFE